MSASYTVKIEPCEHPREPGYRYSWVAYYGEAVIDYGIARSCAEALRDGWEAIGRSTPAGVSV